MKLVATLCLAFVLAAAVVEAVQLGTGGVYDDPASQAYWNRRLGKSGLAAARSAAKLYIARNGSGSSPKVSDNLVEPSTNSNVYRQKKIVVSRKRPRTIYSRNFYVPQFRGTLARPHKLWSKYQLKKY